MLSWQLTGLSPLELRLTFHIDPTTQAALAEELAQLAGIQKTVLIYPSTGGRPRAAAN